MGILRKFKGKIILIDQEKKYFSQGSEIFSQSNLKKEKIIKLPVSIFMKTLMRFHLISRMLRLGVHHFIYDGKGGYYCIYNKKCARFSSNGELIGKPLNLIGGRPLRVDLYNNELIYGEYCSNQERNPVSIISYNGFDQKKLLQIKNVRHIHTVRCYQDKIYFSTGDYKDEAGIWCWDGKTTTPIIRGSQQTRAVDFMIINEVILYGTDTPLEKNYIYKSDFKGNLEKLQNVSGSVFYMSYQANRYWLATVIEPSDVNTSHYIELWCSSPHDLKKWELVEKFKKDIWHMKLFQYGQIQFPYGFDSSKDVVYFYLQGVNGSGYSVEYSIAY